MSKNNNMYNMCLVGTMDRLWFHQIILLSQPNISLMTPQINNIIEEEEDQSFNSESPLSLSTSSLEDHQDIELNSPPKTPKKERHRRRSRSFESWRNRSHSSLSSSIPRLEKSMSCRSFGELELEELKGFLDLGFTFNKEDLSPKMMSLIPGLQRLNSLNENSIVIGEEDVEDQEKSRPYLSEAWLIKRPSSPLLNLKVPRLSQASDMKKHLKFWARTVASVIQQES